MASFSIDAYTYDSVTISASGLTSGKVIRFFIRLASDTSDITINEEYTASTTSMTKTFNGLSSETDYAVNVHDGTEWLGAQEFTTAARPKVRDGVLIDIPVLDSDYPLFDWGDWPGSYSALVSGGQTSEFEKECWNAIVNTLGDALSEGGISWDTKYETLTNSLITEEYGDLYANVFNGVRYNIDRPAPLGWAWANDPSFRGYIGREDFRGVDQYGENGADEVYQTYILELVRRMNLLIEIMRADGHALLASAKGISRAINNAPEARIGFAMNTSAMEISASNYYNEGIYRGIGGRIVPVYRSSSTRYLFDAYSKRVGRVRPVNKPFRSAEEGLINAGIRAVASIKSSKTTTKSSTATILRGIPRYFSTRTSIIRTNGVVAGTNGVSAPIYGSGKAMTNQNGAANSTESLPMQARGRSQSDPSVTLDKGVRSQVSANGMSKSDVSISINQTKGADTVYHSISKFSNIALLGTAWYPPEWQADGSLLIRQSHEVTLTDGILEVI